MSMNTVEEVVANLINELLLTKDIERIRKINKAILHVRELQNGNGRTSQVEITIPNLDETIPPLDKKLPSS